MTQSRERSIMSRRVRIANACERCPTASGKWLITLMARGHGPHDICAHFGWSMDQLVARIRLAFPS